jgi:hypothetical protein
MRGTIQGGVYSTEYLNAISGLIQCLSLFGLIRFLIRNTNEYSNVLNKKGHKSKWVPNGPIQQVENLK